MIVGNRKSLEEIQEMINPIRKSFFWVVMNVSPFVPREGRERLAF